MSDSNFRRVPLLDELRGLVILLMVFYHAAYDLVYIFGVNWPFFSSPLMHWLQLFIATSFITVSGICCRFSRNNLKRGLLTFGLGMVLTVVTSLFIPEQIVRFGVLHLLGASMVLFALLEPPRLGPRFLDSCSLLPCMSPIAPSGFLLCSSGSPMPFTNPGGCSPLGSLPPVSIPPTISR